MEMKQCPKGHYYDESKTDQCPECQRIAATRLSEDIGVTAPVKQSLSDRARPDSPSATDSDHTIALIQKEIGIDPIVGWLVCVKGAEKGRDFRIHAENNYIGRSRAMDICIDGDDGISRENAAMITFDSTENIFYFAPAGGRGIVRVNGKAALGTVELSPYDRIEIGSTSLIFVPFCGVNYQWQ